MSIKTPYSSMEVDNATELARCTPNGDACLSFFWLRKGPIGNIYKHPEFPTFSIHQHQKCSFPTSS